MPSADDYAALEPLPPKRRVRCRIMAACCGVLLLLLALFWVVVFVWKDPWPTDSLKYTVDTRCQGKSFFDCFDLAASWNCVQSGGTRNFWSTSVDCSEGPTYYVDKPEMVVYGPDGLIDIQDDYVVIRAGKIIDNPDDRKSINMSGQMEFTPLLRESVRLTSKKSWKYMLLAMKYTRLPVACGSWPAFWILGPGTWPGGGELDIMEWANLDVLEMTSLHTTEACHLDPFEVNRYADFVDVNFYGDWLCGHFGREWMEYFGHDCYFTPYDCQTAYPAHKGCGPNRASADRRPEIMGGSPGVFAMEWTPEAIKVFHFKEHEIPADLEAEDPQTGGWSKNILGYYPFKASGASCPNYTEVMEPQTIRLNQAYCGDLASFVKWGGRCADMAKELMGGDMSDSTAWTTCQEFMLSHEADDYMRNNAYWNVSYIKVFKAAS